MRENKDIRIFFALWPDDDTRRQLQQRALTLAVDRIARRVPQYNLHLTLHYIGDILVSDLDCLQQRAREAVVSPFEVSIDSAGSFARPRVAWLGCSDPPAGLIHLHADLGKRLRGCGFRPEKRRFQPHVTVARKISAAPPAPGFIALQWPVDRFALIESQPFENGVKYAVIESYPLT